jgi:hypothetical protein
LGFVLPGLIIVRLDVFAILDEIVQDPELAGLIDVPDSSVLGFPFIRQRRHLNTSASGRRRSWKPGSSP